MIRRVLILLPLWLYGYGEPPALGRGGISSGGGEFIKDRANPWYLQNTAEIRYCIAYDASTFSPSLAQVEETIDAAFGYWTSEMAKSEPAAGPFQAPFETILVGTQSLRREECTPTTDLIFQLGSLTAAQRQALNTDLSMVVAHTERTAYDLVNLHGQGFIYVAADQGPNGLAAAITPGAWSWNHGDALFAILTHELGHIYGLLDGAQGSDLMSYTFAQTIMQTVHDYPNEQTPIFLPNTVKISENLHPGPDTCLPTGSPATRDWQTKTLGLPRRASPCIATHYENSTLEVLAAGPGAGLQLIGAAKLQETVEDGQPLVSVWLPPQQTVYRYVDAGKKPANDLPQPVVYQRIITATGLYRPLGSTVTTQIYVDLDPGKHWPPHILGVIPGKGIRDLYRYQADGVSVQIPLAPAP